MYKNPALESIQFQKSDLFNEITQCISKMRDKSKVKAKDFYDSPEIKELSQVISKYTGITFGFGDCDFGPATYIPRLDQHIFDDVENIKIFQQFWDGYDLHYDLRKVLKALDTDLIDGTVSLKEAKVTGFFTKLKCWMFLPRDYLFDTTFINEELAAIVLHEVGHVFTSFEYLDRTVTTNQALGVMLKTMDNSTNSQDKKVVFAKAKDKLNLDDDAFKIILDSNDKDLVTLVVMNQQIEDCKSELGASVYDVVSCEFLADQFSARHGAGRYLVTGLDKLFSRGMTNASAIYLSATINSVLITLSLVISGGPVIGLAVAVLAVLGMATNAVYTASKLDTEFIYDNSLTRLNRIKHQMVQRLKDPGAGNDEKKYILNYLDEVEPVIKKYAGDNDVKLRNRIAFFFSKKHKYDFEYMSLQKDLEEMGNSNLFIMSEKLKNL